MRDAIHHQHFIDGKMRAPGPNILPYPHSSSWSLVYSDCCSKVISVMDTLFCSAVTRLFLLDQAANVYERRLSHFYGR